MSFLSSLDSPAPLPLHAVLSPQQRQAKQNWLSSELLEIYSPAPTKSISRHDWSRVEIPHQQSSPPPSSSSPRLSSSREDVLSRSNSASRDARSASLISFQRRQKSFQKPKVQIDDFNDDPDFDEDSAPPMSGDEWKSYSPNIATAAALVSRAGSSYSLVDRAATATSTATTLKRENLLPTRVSTSSGGALSPIFGESDALSGLNKTNSVSFNLSKETISSRRSRPSTRTNRDADEDHDDDDKDDETSVKKASTREGMPTTTSQASMRHSIEKEDLALHQLLQMPKRPTGLSEIAARNRAYLNSREGDLGRTTTSTRLPVGPRNLNNSTITEERRPSSMANYQRKFGEEEGDDDNNNNNNNSSKNVSVRMNTTGGLSRSPPGQSYPAMIPRSVSETGYYRDGEKQYTFIPSGPVSENAATKALLAKQQWTGDSMSTATTKNQQQQQGKVGMLYPYFPHPTQQRQVPRSNTAFAVSAPGSVPTEFAATVTSSSSTSTKMKIKSSTVLPMLNAVSVQKILEMDDLAWKSMKTKQSNSMFSAKSWEQQWKLEIAAQAQLETSQEKLRHYHHQQPKSKRKTR